MSRTITLRTVDGRKFDTSDGVILGRSPRRDGYTPIELNRDAELTSKNHLLVTPSDQVVELLDLGSTNGTTVTIGSASVTLVAHERTHVTLPCTLHCGDALVELSRHG